MALDDALVLYTEGKSVLYNAFCVLETDTDLNTGIKAMFDRDDYEDTLTPFLRGIAVHPPARKYLDRVLDEYFNQCRARWFDGKYDAEDEVVIGAGLHGAIYCATRSEADGTQMLVFDAAPRIGGMFARSNGSPAFMLNSRNRPGSGIPGSQGGLNFIPNGLIQPADISSAEYQTNDDFAFCIRLNLALMAKAVIPRAKVRLIEDNGRPYINGEGWGWDAARVIVAPGIGDPRSEFRSAITFDEFMIRAANDFPLQGLRRVAVVGAGDSSKVAIEYLLGMGPSNNMSVATMDYVEQIDWYGQKCATREEYQRAPEQGGERSRYAGIGRHMPRESEPNAYARVYPINARVQRTTGASVVSIDEYSQATLRANYDLIICCTGYEDKTANLVADASLLPVTVNGKVVAQQYGDTNVYRIGPVMNLEPTGEERQIAALRKIKANSVAAFRYADRTAAFAELMAGALV